MGDTRCHAGDASDRLGLALQTLQLGKGEHLLVRGGTTSVGLAAAAIARNFGAVVSSTTRNSGREQLLRDHGATTVFVDSGTVADDVRNTFPNGVDKVLELIGVTTLKDSLRCVRPGGIVCMTGIVGSKWSFEEFAPMEAIPSAVGLTVYAGGSSDFMRTPLEDLA